jgi:phosphate transport system substrate-binding protein
LRPFHEGPSRKAILVIDKLRARWLSSRGCVFREAFGNLRVGALLSASVLAVCMAGCSPRSAPRTAEDTVTTGRIKVVCASEVYGLVSRERSAFQSLYPQADIELEPGTSRSAIRDLFAATCDLAVITRELRPEERRAAIAGRLDLEGYRFARSAVLMVVHPSNPVENLALEDVRGICRGDARRWEPLGGARMPIVPVIQPTSSDVTEFFVEEALGGEDVRARAVVARSDSDVVSAVARNPAMIGYVSLGTRASGVKILRIATLRGLPYWKPDLEAVYKGDYPLTRFYNLYVRVSGPRLANGFITYITSIDGQRSVKDAGLVPTSVPVRFVRRSPMLSTHSRGDSTSIP